jgi:hypothetical protein
MAGFTEKIRILFDIDSTNASSSLKSLRTSVNDADGAFGKAKAGAAGLGGMLKENMGAAAIAGGAAIVAFGVKAVGAFTDTAKAALDLSSATGLSSEESSRWIAVADDFEISAEQLTSGLGKIGKTLDSGKWEDYGIATRDAGGEARSTNDILTDSLVMLGDIENETERARVGNELFGKGYANLSPLIGKTKDEYEGMLGAVEDGQVITAKEAAKAEKMRLAQDALSDALQEVTLAVGGMVAEMAPAIETLSSAITKAIEWREALGPLPDAIMAVTNPLIAFDKAQGLATGSAEKLSGETLPELIAQLEDLGWSEESIKKATDQWKASNEAAEPTVDDLGDAAKDTESKLRVFSDAANEAAIATDAAEAATRRLDDAYNTFIGSLDQADAFADFEVAMWNYRAEVEHSDQSTRDYKRSIADTIIALDNIPEETKTALLAQLDTGSIVVVEDYLQRLGRGVNVPVRFTPTGDAIGVDGARAAGGPVSAGSSYLVGERGPEVVTFGSSGYVTPNNKLGGGGPVSITINAPTGNAADIERAVVAALKRYQQRGGIV